MEENNSSIFTQAKIEYTQQLIDVLTQPMVDGIKSIYDESKVVYSTQTNLSILNIFRTFLEKVPGWNNELVEVETERIIKESNCDWLDDLVTAVFISHTKILTSIGPNFNNTRINLTIPKTIIFIHKCYINLAREIWKNPYLFDENIVGSEYQKNMRTIELITKESVENTIRKLLPFKEILKEHLDTFDTNETENKKRLENENIQSMLLKEIRSLKDNMNNSENSDNSDNSDNEEIEDNDSPNERNEITTDMTSVLNDIANKLTKNESAELSAESALAAAAVAAASSINTSEVKPSNDGYESPDEEKIKNNCEELEINTIQDITASEIISPVIDANVPTVEVDIKYDNPEIIANPTETNTDLMDSFKNNLIKLEGQNIVEIIEDKSDNNSEIYSPRIIQSDVNPVNPINPINPIEDPLFNNGKIIEVNKLPEKIEEIETKPLEVKEEVVKKEVKEVKEVKEEVKLDSDIKGIIMGNKKINKKPPVDVKEIKVVKEDLKIIDETIESKDEKVPVMKEIISVDKNINDDAETVDNFVNDISALLERKGLKIDKEPKKYTLFDDADENE